MALRLEFSDEQAMLLEGARSFCAERSTIAVVRSLLQDALGYREDVWKEIVQLGWMGIAIPEALGGSGLGVGSVVPVIEAMGRHLMATPFIDTTLAAQAILRAGDGEQKAYWLPRLAGGTVGTLAWLENEDWGDIGFQCRAVPSDGGWVLSGAKILVPYGHCADVFAVAVGHQDSVALALVTRDQLDQSRISAHSLIDETKRASRIDVSGLALNESALMTNDVGATLQNLRLQGALLTAAEATGSAAACLDSTVEYLNTRKQFGRLIGSFQALKHTAAHVLLEVDSAKSLLYHAATLVGDGSFGVEQELACRMAKVQANEALTFAGDRAVQFHGGMGFTYECDAQLFIRRGQWLQQQFGDSFHHRKRLASLLLD